MQSASNRDNFIRINYQNMASKDAENFQKYGPNDITDFGVPFDFYSVMFYRRADFSINGRDTITTLNPAYQNVIGNSPTLSTSDARKINLMYGC